MYMYTMSIHMLYLVSDLQDYWDRIVNLIW
jgi:hypothetical protein